MLVSITGVGLVTIRDGKTKIFRFDTISSIRLLYDPTRFETNRYRCVITWKTGESLDVRSVTFEVPGDATVAKVSGPMVGNWEAKAGKAGTPQVVAVELKGDFKGTTPIVVELDRAWDEKPPYAIPLTKTRGVERASGFVAISALTGSMIKMGLPVRTKGR